MYLGFEDTFTASATGALEFGSIPYAKGVIDNWLRYYIRSNGMTTYRAEELAQSGRMLTICALYVSMTGDSGQWISKPVTLTCLLCSALLTVLVLFKLFPQQHF